MRFLSTRGGHTATLTEAIECGLARDGGLFVPEAWPEVRVDAPLGTAAFATRVLEPFCSGDPLGDQIGAICAGALTFPLPLVPLPGRDAAVLELYWGPTAAFKDVGARFLAECVARLPGGERTILVATSGDTGGAVAAAFWRKPRVRVGILFPTEGVSPRQRHQLTCWGENVASFAVRGTFDDCQRLLKRALAERTGLTTANSINIGRLLPQVCYYAKSSLEYVSRFGAAPGILVPSGNVGNVTAALWARRIGFPIREVVMATNANRTIPDFLESGAWEPRPSVETLANAMDVGDPSNMERVFALYPDRDALRRELRAVAVDDDTIRRTIAAGEQRWGRAFDPHTATAIHAFGLEETTHWIVVATAHPAKFETVVEPLLGHAVEVPAALAALLERPARCVEIDPELDALESQWQL